MSIIALGRSEAGPKKSPLEKRVFSCYSSHGEYIKGKVASMEDSNTSIAPLCASEGIGPVLPGSEQLRRRVRGWCWLVVRVFAIRNVPRAKRYSSRT